MNRLEEYYDLQIQCKDGERKCIEKDFKKKAIMVLLKAIGSKTHKGLVHTYKTEISMDLLDVLMCFATNKPLPNFAWIVLENVLIELHNLAGQLLETLVEWSTFSEVEQFLTEMKKWLVTPLVKDLSPDNCISVWKFTKFLFPKDADLEKRMHSVIEKLLVRTIRESTVDTAFHRLTFRELKHFLDSDELKLAHETEIFDVITYWIDSLPEEREKYAADLVTSIRKGSIPKHLKDFRNLNLADLNFSEKMPRNSQETMMMIGGWSGGPLQTIDIFDYINNEWLEFPIRIPFRSAYHGSVYVDGELYIIGGIDNATSTIGYNSLIKLNRNLVWESLSNMAEIRFYITNSCVDLSGFIYVFGGFNGISPERHRTVERYNIETNSWHYLNPMPFPRSDAAAAVVHGRIFVVGGYAGSGPESTGQPLLAMVDMFDPNSGTWTTLQALPEPRAGHSLLLHAHALLVVGGWDGVNVKQSVYSARGSNPRRWEENRNMINQRKCFSSTVVNGGIYVAGGHNGSNILSEAEYFNGSIWERAAPMRFPRSATRLITLDASKAMKLIRMAQDLATKLNYSESTANSSLCFTDEAVPDTVAVQNPQQ